jgi:hypothetical protein
VYRLDLDAINTTCHKLLKFYSNHLPSRDVEEKSFLGAGYPIPSCVRLLLRIHNIHRSRLLFVVSLDTICSHLGYSLNLDVFNTLAINVDAS